MSMWFIAAAIFGLAACALAVIIILRWRSRFDDPETEERVRRLLWGLEGASALAFLALVGGMLTRQSVPSATRSSSSGQPTRTAVLPSLPVGTFMKTTYPRKSSGPVARNTAIVLWFVKPIDPSTLTTGTQVLPDAFTLRDKTTNQPVAFSTELSSDQTIAVLQPQALLGDGVAPRVYEATVGRGLRTRDGDPVANPVLIWDVVVGRDEDHAPPTIISRFPDQPTAPKNAIAQLTFSKPMNPLSVLASGVAALKSSSASAAAGTVAFSDDFRTLEVFGSVGCGVNACGKSMRCFTANASYTLAIAGAKDMSGNVIASTPPLAWKTVDRVERTAPAVVRVIPKPDASGVSLDTPVVATFSSAMSATTLTTSATALPAAWWELSMVRQGIGSALTLLHAPFSSAQVPISSVLTSDLVNVYQQCYEPCLGP